MRLFLAADIDQPARTLIAAWMTDVAAAMSRDASKHSPADVAGEIKWVEPVNLHITLHFFGEVPTDATERLFAALAAPLTLPAFDLHLDDAGTFPRSGPPRVLWMGIGEGQAALTRIHAALQDRLRPLGWADPADARPFSPHLTIGRVRTPAAAVGRAIRTALERQPAPAFFPFPVNRLTLYQSRLSPRGPEYVPQVFIDLMPSD